MQSATIINSIIPCATAVLGLACSESVTDTAVGIGAECSGCFAEVVARVVVGAGIVVVLLKDSNKSPKPSMNRTMSKCGKGCCDEWPSCSKATRYT